MTKIYQPGWRSLKHKNRNYKRRFIVFQLKLILPIAILTTLAFMFFWPQIATLIQSDAKPRAMEQILKTNPLLENKVIHPTFESLDKNGRPFVLEADYALNTSKEKTDFIKPSGHLALEDGSTLSFNAKTGQYYKNKDTLVLKERVNVKTDKGYNLQTESMTLYPKENRGEGNQAVYGTGPSGESIEAEGFKITDKGDKIDFLGKTKISLPGL